MLVVVNMLMIISGVTLSVCPFVCLSVCLAESAHSHNMAMTLITR